MKVSAEDLVVTSRSRRLGVKESRSLVSIQDNVMVRFEVLEPEAKPWEIGQRVTEARIAASSVVAPSTSGDLKPFAHQSAMVAWGIESIDWSPPITRRCSGGAHRLVRLPPVTVGSVTIPGTVLRTSRIDVGDRGSMKVLDGVFADRLRHVAVDLARTLPPSKGIAEVSKILQKEVDFNKHAPQQCRRKEQEVRSLLLQTNALIPSPFGRTRAFEVLSLADAGAESPGEATLMWMVHKALQGGSDAGLVLRTQFKVGDGWNHYFIDLALPEKRVAIEFDGQAKLMPDSPLLIGQADAVRHEEVDAKLRDQWVREDNLRALGWRTVRIKSIDMRNPKVGMSRLVSRLQSVGIKAAVPKRW